MFTVALIGPDGAGKTTLCRLLERQLPLPARYVYMGINLETSTLMLPWTRAFLMLKRALGRRPDLAGPRDPARLDPLPRGRLRRAAKSLKSSLRLSNQIAEEWYRQAVVSYHVWRGRVVLFDRHFFIDYYASDIAKTGGTRPLARRLHGYLLNRWYPRPDLTILLDAPAATLFARKGEGSLDYLERRREEYRQLAPRLRAFATVDATQPLETVARHVRELIDQYAQQRLVRPEHVPSDTTEVPRVSAYRPGPSLISHTEHHKDLRP